MNHLQNQQPLNGLTSNQNVTLKHVGLGIGLQNYTCNGTAYVQSLPGSGGYATLYDVTDYLAAKPQQAGSLTRRSCAVR